MTRLRTHFAFRVDTWTTALCHIDALAEEVWNGKPRMGGDPTVYRKDLTSLPTHGTFMTSTNMGRSAGGRRFCPMEEGPRSFRLQRPFKKMRSAMPFRLEDPSWL